MSTAAHMTDDRTRPDSAAGGRRAADGLSNDYLNHFNEVLMLVEIAADAPEIVADLQDWRPVSYPEYFAASNLRHAPEAGAAYDRVAVDRRAAFEELVHAMDRLAMTAIRALRPPCEAEDAGLVAEVTAPALRALIAQAGAFLNSGGRDIPDSTEIEEAQLVIDRLLAHVNADDGVQLIT
ncbi:MAG: hypothetical protein HLUCCO17_01270 [Saliniramus fredricksonii]|uniref:Uncharacterized protein n=1 Tax=Saliniramus fredricksonii TaxID=1653334 RepID=A0A0N8KF00_9HYPH|nr:hypothetical protein [Saliniramus fredricksonii]KPQ12754.1 MAG: hypothetical protein HLUCCO17_01270 [Saliniramus fredricksonii]SCC82569.1 hypothetical protein GA0071312_3575 [Saliniramus fredricksonii]